MENINNPPQQGFVFKFKFHPQAAERPRFDSINRRAYNSKKYRNYQTLLQYSIKRQIPVGWKMLERDVYVEIEFEIERPKTVTRELPTVKPDLDNMVKAVFDGMNGLVWKDDAQVIQLVATKTYAEKDPSITVTVGYNGFNF